MQTQERNEEQVSAANAEEQVEEISVDSLGNGKIDSEKPKLDGQEVEIESIALIPKNEKQKTLNGKHTVRNVLLKIIYKGKGHENYGGIKQFLDEETGVWKEPSLWAASQSAATALFKTWCKHTTKSPKDVSLKEFLQSLVGMKGTIQTQTEEYNKEDYTKNIIVEFVQEQGSNASSANQRGEQDGNIN